MPDNPLENLATIDTLEIDQLTSFVEKIEALVQGDPDSPDVGIAIFSTLT